MHKGDKVKATTGLCVGGIGTRKASLGEYCSEGHFPQATEVLTEGHSIVRTATRMPP